MGTGQLDDHGLRVGRLLRLDVGEPVGVGQVLVDDPVVGVEDVGGVELTAVVERDPLHRRLNVGQTVLAGLHDSAGLASMVRSAGVRDDGVS